LRKRMVRQPMAKTLLQLRTMVADATQALRNSRGIDPSEGDLNDQINWAYRTIASKMSMTIDTPLTLTAEQNAYNLCDKSCTSVVILDPQVLYINSGSILPLWDASGQETGFWHIDELNELYRYWKN